MDRSDRVGEPVSGAVEVLVPAAGRGSGVLVVHPWWGLNATVRTYAGALSAEGFVVGLVDAFEGEVVTSQEAAQAQLERHWEAAPGRIGAAFNAFAAHEAVAGGISGLGFSFGGFQLLGLIGTLPLRRLVTYYADREVALGGVPVLGHFAQTDSFADDQEGMIRAIEAAGPPSAAWVYPGTQHWFAEADRPEYEPEAAALAFERSVDFLLG